MKICLTITWFVLLSNFVVAVPEDSKSIEHNQKDIEESKLNKHGPFLSCAEIKTLLSEGKEIDPNKVDLNTLDISCLSSTELDNLPECIIMQLPAIELLEHGAFKDLAEKDAAKSLCIFMLGESLQELKYYIGEIPSGKMTPKLIEAIKEFQLDIKHKSTGILLFGEMNEIMDREKKLHPQKIIMPFRCFSKYDDYVLLEGTWAFVDQETYPAMQTSKIELHKNTMQGIEANASINYAFSSLGYDSLSVDIIEWKIQKWDDEEIVAENSTPTAAIYTMTVNLKTDEVMAYKRPKGDKGKKYGTQYSLLKLIDGLDVSIKFHMKRLDEEQKVLNSKYQQIYMEILGKYKSK